MANEDDPRVRADDPRVRAVAKVPRPRQQRGVAKVSAEDVRRTGRIYWPVTDRQPVFVDDSGRRGRWLAWLAVVVVLLGLALLAALWWSQVTSTGG